MNQITLPLETEVLIPASYYSVIDLKILVISRMNQHQDAVFS